MSTLDVLAEASESDLKRNPYPGRVLICGVSPSGRRIIQVYAIMGRSESSRNRVFAREPDGAVRTRAHDPSKLGDPSLIIYRALGRVGRAFVATNGDQTDTVLDALRRGGGFEEALFAREFEPDAPNYTPRISCVADLDDGRRAYALSILKRGASGACDRHFFSYGGAPGYGHLIHTYRCDGEPLPSFEGEPRLVSLPEGAEEAAKHFWALLARDNRVSIAGRAIDRDTGAEESFILNAREGA